MEEPLDRHQAGPSDRASGRDQAPEGSASGLCPVSEMLAGIPEPALILGPDRRITAANDEFASLAGRRKQDLVGLLVGEALQCVHVEDDGDECGGTGFCSVCAADTVLRAGRESGRGRRGECRLTCRRTEGIVALDLEVTASPLTLGGSRCTLFVLRETSGEKRREVLERLFFHDLLNSAGGLAGITEIWPRLAPAEQAQLIPRIRNLASQMVEDIREHSDLQAAERGDLTVRLEQVEVPAFLENIGTLYRHHALARGRSLVVRPGADAILTDRRLLSRVLGNLIKNAFEASAPGQTITVGAQREIGLHGQDGIVFTVHNAGVMPHDTQLQVFQRSFSTKGEPGRGLGTYCARLLTENYLGGKVGFTSAAESGTTFRVWLPDREAPNR